VGIEQPKRKKRGREEKREEEEEKNKGKEKEKRSSSHAREARIFAPPPHLNAIQATPPTPSCHLESTA
jgi:hypothetical protein